MIFKPEPLTPIAEGDHLIVLGEQQDLDRLEKSVTDTGHLKAPILPKYSPKRNE
jgi:uncharacterized protein with PhoU and TrkA domain